MMVGCCCRLFDRCQTGTIDPSNIPVNKRTNARLWWTKYSDLYEIVHREPRPHFFLFAHWSVMWERSICNSKRSKLLQAATVVISALKF